MDRQKRIDRIRRIQKIRAKQGQQAQEVPATMDEDPGFLSSDQAFKFMDYPAGIPRAAIASRVQQNARALESLTGIDTGGFKNLISQEEQLQALNPVNRKLAPESAELFRRAGMGQGGQLSNAPLIGSMYEDPSKTGKDTWWPNVGGMMDITGRGAAGFATDIALDPTTYMTIGALPAIKKGVGALRAMRAAGPVGTSGTRNMLKSVGGGAAKVGAGATVGTADFLMNKPVSTGLREGGGWVYKQAFKEADIIGEHLGKMDKYAPSEVAYKYGIIGTPEQIRRNAGKVVGDLKDDADDLIKQTEQAVKQGNKEAQFDINKALGETAMFIRQQLDSGNLEPEAEAVYKSVQKKLSNLRKAGTPIPPSKEKRQLMQTLREEGPHGMPPAKYEIVDVEEFIPGKKGADLYRAREYKANLASKVDWSRSTQTELEDKLLRQAAEGIRKEMIRAVETATGKGARFEEINREMGALLTAAPTLIKESDKYIKKGFSSQVDAMALWMDPGLLAAKTASRVGKAKATGTILGGTARSIGEVAQKARIDPMLKRSLINKYGRDNYVERQPQGYAPTSAWQKVGF